MLWRKAWLETRWRFLACLCFITAFVVWAVHHEEVYVISTVPTRDTYLMIFYIHHTFIGLWMLSVVLVGMGGLIREQAVGTSSLTLALPATRARLFGVQLAVGLLEAISLAAVPWVAILLTTALEGRPFPITQAAFYTFLLTSGGLMYFALAVLVSSVLEGEYTAPAVAYGIMILTGLIFDNVEWLRPYADLWRYMDGKDYLNNTTYLLAGPFPWLGALAALSVTALLLLTSGGIIYKQDF